MILFTHCGCVLRVKNVDKDKAQIRAEGREPHSIYQVGVNSYWISMHSLADTSFQCYSGKTVKTEPEVEQAQESPVQLKKAVSKPAKKSRTAVSTKAIKKERDAQGLDESAGEQLQTEGRPSVKPKKQKPVKSNAEQQTEPDNKGTLGQAQDQPKSKRKRAASVGGNGNGASASATNAVTNVRPQTTRQLLHCSPCLHYIAFCPNLDSRFHTLISWRNANS